MQFLKYVRLATYVLILVIAFIVSRTSHIISVRLGDNPAPGPGPVVTEPAGWRGRDEAWIEKQLGLPQWRHAIRQPVPDIGVFEGVQSRLEKAYPGYSKEIRSLIWKKGPRSFQVFLVQPADSWVVLDAVSWQEGVEF